MAKLFLAVAFFILSTLALADEDPVASGLNSGRFQTKAPLPDDQPVYQQQIKPKRKKVKPVAAVPSAIPNPKHDYGRSPAQAQTEEDFAKATLQPPPTLGDQLQDIFLAAGGDHTNEKYRSLLHPDDIRNNHLELDVGTGMVYDNSTASISYRNYYSVAPFVNVAGHLWITPLLGVSASYLGTYAETLSSTSAVAPAVNAKSQWTTYSLDLRHFYGMSRKANSLNYGLTYSQSSLALAPTETTRVGLSSSGLGAYMNVRIPTAPSYAWTFGGHYYPQLLHNENETNLALQSGASNMASRLELSLGGEIKLSRQSQLLWSVDVSMEKDQFSGPATLPDPVNGQTPSSVSVLNTWTYFHLGYRWGQ